MYIHVYELCIDSMNVVLHIHIYAYIYKHKHKYLEIDIYPHTYVHHTCTHIFYCLIALNLDFLHCFILCS